MEASVHTSQETTIAVRIAEVIQESAKRTSQRAIAKRCQASSRVYLARLQNNEIAVEKMDVEKVFDVLAACVGPKQSMEIVLSDELLSKKMVESRACTKKQLSTLSTSEELRSFYQNTDYSTIMTLASIKVGTTREEIVDVCGKRGAQHLSELLAKEVLEVGSNGRIRIAPTYLKDNEVLSFSRQDYRDFRIPDLLKYYNPENANKQTNAIIARVEGLNGETVKKIHKLAFEFVKEVDRLIAEPDALGDIPYFVALAMDRLTPNKEVSLEREVLQ